jgi:hypothetical protein
MSNDGQKTDVQKEPQNEKEEGSEERHKWKEASP